MPTTSNAFAILILAAGKSSRLGTPKQLLLHENEALLRRVAKQALCLTSNVFVVLGHEKEACLKVLEGLPVYCCFNEAYLGGIGNSLSFGIAQTRAFPYTLIMLCDQPFIPLSHYSSLMSHLPKKTHTIIASQYEGESKYSVPALFPQHYYDALLKLDGDKGAQSLLNLESCIGVSLSKSLAVDIDTREDVENFIR